MEFVIIIALLGWGGYKLFKFNTSAGAEVLRAAIYLEILLKGGTRNDAQRIAGYDMADVDTAVIRRVQQEVRDIHDNKPLQVVAEAYRQGMSSKMPRWYQRSAVMRRRSPSILAAYTAPIAIKEREQGIATATYPEWVKGFAFYFLLEELSDAEIGPFPGAVIPTDNILDLLEANVPERTTRLLAKTLKWHMAFFHPNIPDFKAEAVLEFLQAYLRMTVKEARKKGPVCRALQMQVTTLTGEPMDQTEAEQLVDHLLQDGPGRELVPSMVFGMLLQSESYQHMQAIYGKKYEELAHEMTGFLTDKVANRHGN